MMGWTCHAHRSRRRRAVASSARPRVAISCTRCVSEEEEEEDAGVLAGVLAGRRGGGIPREAAAPRDLRTKLKRGRRVCRSTLLRKVDRIYSD
jgi:hypothetical protein